MKSPIKPRAKAVRFNLFFLEMIIVLFFFSIAAAVILNSFAISNSLAKKSRRTEAMAFCAQSAAEIFSETGDFSQTVETLFGTEAVERITFSPEENDLPDGYILASESIILPLDENCKYSPENKELIMMMSVFSDEYDHEGFSRLCIEFNNGIMIHGAEPYYELYSGVYIPPETSERTANENEQ